MKTLLYRFTYRLFILLCCNFLLIPAQVTAHPAQAPQGGVFTYAGNGFTVQYNFTPNTGSLNDLVVTYNDAFSFHPSNFGGIYAFELAGETLLPWEGKHQSSLISESNDNGVYTARFRWSYQGDSLEFTIKLWLEQQTLRVEFDSSSTNIHQFSLDRSEETPNPKVVELPYGHNVLFSNGIFVSGMIEWQVSNAANLSTLNTLFSPQSAYFGIQADYNPLTDGTRQPLHERIALAVSPNIEETFYHPPNPVSPYRQELQKYVIADIWAEPFSNIQDLVQQFANEGMTDLLVLVHKWQRYGYDNGLPTSYPANLDWGGAAGIQAVADVCANNGYLFALHTNYVDFYQNSDVWNPADVALNQDGSWHEAWYNKFTGQQSYLIKPTRARAYAEQIEPQMHSNYRTTASFMDVHSAVLPSQWTEYEAGVPGAGRQKSVFTAYTDLLAYGRDVHQGPIIGEGFGFSTPVWAGYVDAIEGDPRSTVGMAQATGGTATPLLVDYKLRALHGLFIPHGAGYIERFYDGKLADYSTAELERYRATELAFGNAGFLPDPLTHHISLAQSKSDYCFLKHIQARYLAANVSQIRYRVGSKFLTLSDTLRKVLPLLAYDQVFTRLNTTLAIVNIEYDNGLSLYVNRSTNRNLKLTIGGVNYTLPPNGFLARQGTQFLAYSALVGGTKVESICPVEASCGSCEQASLPAGEVSIVAEEEPGDAEHFVYLPVLTVATNAR